MTNEQRKQALARALDHHTRRGLVEYWGLDDDGKYHVRPYRSEALVLSYREALALVSGLAAADRYDQYHRPERPTAGLGGSRRGIDPEDAAHPPVGGKDWV